MIMLLASLLQSAPPIPAPQEKVEAAALLWRENPPSPQFKNSMFSEAAYPAAEHALREAGAKPSSPRYTRQLDELRKRLIRRRLDRDAEADAQLAYCASSGLAYHVTLDQLSDVRRFVRSPTGRAFWQAVNWNAPLLRFCYQRMLRADDGDLLAVGLRPAKKLRENVVF